LITILNRLNRQVEVTVTVRPLASVYQRVSVVG